MSKRGPWALLVGAGVLAAGLGGALAVGQEKERGELLSEGKPIAHWIKALETADASARGQALKAIGNLVKEANAKKNAEVLAKAKAALPALIKAMQDSNSGVRDWAAYAASCLGPDAKPALPILVKLLKDDVQQVALTAANALGSMKAEGKEAVPALIEAVTGEDPWLRWSAAVALGSIGPVAKEAVPALAKGVYDKEYIVRKGATEALGDLGPAAKEAVPTLVRAFEDELQYDNIRKIAAASLKKIDLTAAAKAGIP